MSITVLKFLTAALSEIGVASGSDAVSGDDMDQALTIFNEVADLWNADEQRIFDVRFANYTLTANLQPHTIGIAANSPTFTIPTPVGGGTGTLGNRPQRIIGANLILNTSSPNTYTPLNIADRQWWLGQPTPGLTGANPTDLYYEPAWPNGNIYLWPVPTTAYGIQLELVITFAQFELTDTFSLPPGYQRALRLSVAEALVPSFLVPMPQGLPQMAMEARAIVFDQNTEIPRLISDAPRSGGPNQSNWDWRTGQLTNY